MINPNVCGFCNKEFKYITQHLKAKHKVYDLEQYYQKYILQTDFVPTCKKCSKPTLFQSVQKGYRKTCTPTCDSAITTVIPIKVTKYPVKRRKKNIVNRRVRKKPKLLTISMLNKSFPVWGNKRSKVPRVHVVTDFGEFLLRSKIERNFVYALLRSKQHILKVEYEKTYIRYYSSSQFKYRFYIPDFKIFWTNGNVDIVEIKPEKDKVDPIVVDKQKEATNYCQTHNMKYYMISPKEYKYYIEARVLANAYRNV